ncbi:hypothetical protein SMACR_07807 [Sordaria macrospora]|uniref:WGS project CABT00000000 data, contig 2.41 n=2 Tax=Sordaria macrospora TaxID=5147 RepID=F7W7Y2_SORMK|nr:uncharacterized protein SMAC_07807 [Sordaria macrospora k-hell]KAA8629931.1 hypothetical protein SMACR_07807 [Sordaria macrospora]WPJ64123.1 hypothetical protein SMAC4_07807 [Sordaria macrospora]CCC13625.1 unnamed protein product [Sordaria macrospora k-hell]
MLRLRPTVLALTMTEVQEVEDRRKGSRKVSTKSKWRFRARASENATSGSSAPSLPDYSDSDDETDIPDHDDAEQPVQLPVLPARFPEEQTEVVPTARPPCPDVSFDQRNCEQSVDGAGDERDLNQQPQASSSRSQLPVRTPRTSSARRSNRDSPRTFERFELSFQNLSIRTRTATPSSAAKPASPATAALPHHGSSPSERLTRLASSRTHTPAAATPSSVRSKPSPVIETPTTPSRQPVVSTPMPPATSASFRVYNDSLPASSQPRTPQNLPEARHQSRLLRQGAYTVPAGWRASFSQEQRTPTTSRAQRQRSRREPSPQGLRTPGMVGLYGGSENHTDDGVVFVDIRGGGGVEEGDEEEEEAHL